MNKNKEPFMTKDDLRKLGGDALGCGLLLACAAVVFFILWGILAAINAIFF